MDKPRVSAAPFQATLNTRYYIDNEWWERSNMDFNSQVARLCAEFDYELPQDRDLDEMVDWVDPDTAEVKHVPLILYYVMQHVAPNPDFINQRISLIDGIFRALLEAGNYPMTPKELADRLNRDHRTILKTLSGSRIYQGIRPIQSEG
ncbi:MAG: hypothetical protein ACFB51_09720 [Anaerolineae bacterium]